MVCRTTSIDKTRRGSTLVDVLVASALASIVLMVLGLLLVFGARSFAAMANYVNLDQYSRNTLDRMSKEIRQCNRLLGGDWYYLMFEDGDGGNLLYYYVSSTRTLYRLKNFTLDARPLLTQCDFLRFSIYQRNPIMGTYDEYPTADPSTCKLVQLCWVCSRPILGAGKNTESVQSAKVVIRKQ